MTVRLTFELNSPEEASRILDLLNPNRPTTAAPVLTSVPVAEIPPAITPIPEVQPGTAELAAASTPVASAAVLQLLAESNLDGSEITGSGKGGRLTKADVTAYLKANTPPAAPEVDPFALDDPPPAPAAATKEQVREALVTYQTAVKNSLIAGGKPEAEAGPEAMETARGLLSKISGGAATLGALPEASYGAIVLAATAALNAL